ncbi:MAG: hypothetical protein U0990_02945 [Candidatus Nanopelagicales bacterium]|nr:hypothetical protein [Candidatus Nanopelagicales bacterium]MDZ4249028.1 hypothetical protein [Candidatus Nanopelagicales bacterium]MDZ7576786.1 hypothetical protein [Candidatus Nanopelagicales bacterium]
MGSSPNRRSLVLVGSLAGLLVTVGVLAGCTAAPDTESMRFDATFTANTNGGLNGAGSSVAVQTDGKIIVTGSFTKAGGTSAPRIARFNTDGTPDTSFNASTNGGLNKAGHSVAVQTDGKIIVTGSFTKAGGTSAPRIARFNADGTPDTAFNASTNGGLTDKGWSEPSKRSIDPGMVIPPSGNSVAVQPDGKIVVTGGFNLAGGATANGIARFNADGTPDTSFIKMTNGGLDSLGGNSLAVQPDGKIIVAGGFSEAGGMTSSLVARFEADGRPDVRFIVNFADRPEAGYGSGSSVALQPDGKIIITGSFMTTHGAPGDRIARIDSDGAPDVRFASNTYGGLNGAYFAGFAVALQPDGKIVVTGDFNKAGGIPTNNVARFNADGTPDSNFNENNGGLNGMGYSVAIQPDGGIVLTGSFTTENGAPGNRIARLSPGPG